MTEFLDVLVDVGAGAGRLGLAMAKLLDNRSGLLVPRTEQPIRVRIVRWRPRA